MKWAIGKDERSAVRAEALAAAMRENHREEQKVIITIGYVTISIAAFLRLVNSNAAVHASASVYNGHCPCRCGFR